ncbi:MAG: FecR family protein [Gammaproteobacteria bacterium]
MSEPPKPDPKALSDEAIEWLVLLRSGRAGAAERLRFAEWRARSPEHHRAFEDAERLFGLMCEAAAGEWPAERARSRRSVLAALWRPRLAAGLLTAFLLAAALHVLHLTDPWLSDYHTGTGEQRSIALADGSALLLNTDTAVSLIVPPEARRVRLEHGQALFTVAPDPRRPFEVEAGDLVVQALGTVFEVYEHQGEVAVTVLEHAVEIGLAANPEKAPVGNSPHARLVAGERLRYHPDAGFGAMQAVDVRAASAWQRRKLIVKDQALEGVLSELDRYRPGMIQIVDPALRARRITGVFPLDDPDGALKAIQRALGLGTTQLTPWLVLVHG